MHLWNKFRIFAVDKNKEPFKDYDYEDLQFYGKQCAIHIPAENKKEAVKKLQEQGEAANMSNVYLLHKGIY